MRNKSIAAVLLLVLVGQTCWAANYGARAKAIVANVKSKDQVVPGNPFLLSLANAFVRTYPGKWNARLAKGMPDLRSPIPAHIVNPDNATDVLDIGTMDAAEPPNFVPATTATKTKFKSRHYVEMVREFHRQVLMADRVNNATVRVQDAGTTAQEVVKRIRDAAVTEAATELGDPDNDPEN